MRSDAYDDDWRQLSTGSYGGTDERYKRRGRKRPIGFTKLQTNRPKPPRDPGKR